MIKKKIILSDGKVQEMNIEEVLQQFKPLINRFATRCINMSRTQDKEDYQQIASIKIFECFIEYDEKHAFTTRLMTKLKGEVSKIASYDDSLKRRIYKETSMDCMNTAVDDQNPISEIVGDVDFGIDQYGENEIVKEIFEQLKPKEKHMYSAIIENGMSVSKYSMLMGTTRQAENYRYKKLRSKLDELYKFATRQCS